jgi:hypothetical protein
LKKAPKNRDWLEKAAYFRWEARQRGKIAGSDMDDWKYALLKLETQVEFFFLDLHIQKCADPKERIRLAVIQHIAVFGQRKPTEVVDNMLLDGIPMVDEGLGLAISCDAIGEAAKVGKLGAPENVRTVGDLIKALQESYKPLVPDLPS